MQNQGATNESGKRAYSPRSYYRRRRINKNNITLDWALSNVHLTERKKRILELLNHRRMMTIEQILYLHPDFGHQSQSRFLLQRDINKLHEVYLVDKACYKPIVMWNGAVKKTVIVAMGQLGSELARWKFHTNRIKYSDGQVILSKKAHHTLQVNEMEIITREVANELNLEVKFWVPECGWKIVNHPNELNPDAFCQVLDRKTGNRYSFFAEYDTGNEDIGRTKRFPELTKKFKKYNEVKEWPDWYEKPISQASVNKFPHVFFVTEERKRFPGIPRLLNERKIEHTACMKEEYADRLKEFITNMRGVES